MPDVSVAIATYNGAHYLPELLNSIVAQTVRPTEIVCSDDASTDNTVEVLEEFARTSPVPLKIVRHETNIGIIENFLSAFEATSSPLIAYCDQDDVWFPSKLNYCLKLMDGDTALVCHPSVITDGDLNPTGEVYYRTSADRRLAFPAVSLKMHSWGHQMLFRREALDVLLHLYSRDDFREMELGRNFDLNIPFAASLVGGLTLGHEPQIHFRRHASATSPAGISNGSQSGLSDLLSKRVSGYIEKKMLLAEITVLLSEMPDGLAKNAARSLEQYSSYLQLMERRIALAHDGSMLSRAARIPGLLLFSMRNHSSDEKALKNAAADMLTVFYGHPQGKV
jgi:glycosyltransferase involved in cell wall biosynthesis